jgi:hypothetical protein
VSVKKASSSNRCTVMLGYSMVGKKFPPYTIYGGSEKEGGRIRREISSIREEDSKGCPF